MNCRELLCIVLAFFCVSIAQAARSAEFQKAPTPEKQIDLISVAGDLVGNALVGAYLNQLGLPSSAIMYITEASPTEMQRLTFYDARKYGIDVKSFEMGTRNRSASLEAKPNASPQTSFSISVVEVVTKETYSRFALDDLPLEAALRASEHPIDGSLYGHGARSLPGLGT